MPGTTTSRTTILTKRGNEARQRAMQRAGGNRIPDAAWWPEIELLTELGHTNNEIAVALKMSTRRIRAIRQYGREAGDTLLYPIFEPKAPEELKPEFRAMLDFTADAFESFFNEFSDEKGGLRPHCKEWVADFIANPNLILNVPPRHAKTTIFAVWLPIWLLCINRDEQILLVSKTSRFAKVQCSRIGYYLKHWRPLTDAFGRFAPESEREEIPWRPSAGELMIVGRSPSRQAGQFSVFAVGERGQVFGREATVVIVDDVTDAPIARSETQREEQLSWLKEQVLTRLQPGGRVCVLGQRVHFMDLYGQLAEETYERGPRRGQLLWHHILHPAIIRWPEGEDDKGETLWPDLWDFEALMATYERIGDSSFQCLYQQNPLPAGAALVQPEWWLRCHDENRKGFEGYKRDLDNAYFPIARVVSVDPADTRWGGIVVCDIPYQRDNFYAVVLEAKQYQGGLRTLLSELERTIDQYRPDYVIIEEHTHKNWLHEDPVYQRLQRRTTILGHNTGKNKGDPGLGVESLGGDVELARISLPYADAAGQQMSKLLEDEANVWPHGSHDDVLMALWFVKWNFKRLIPRGAIVTQFRSVPGAGKGWQEFKKSGADVVTEYRRRMKRHAS